MYRTALIDKHASHNKTSSIDAVRGTMFQSFSEVDLAKTNAIHYFQHIPSLFQVPDQTDQSNVGLLKKTDDRNSESFENSGKFCQS